MNNLNRTSNKISLVLIAIFSLFFIMGCAKKLSFQRSRIVPAAEGRVKVKQDKNKNYAIDISVKNLAQAKDLTPSSSTYVIWMETNDNGYKNIGQLKSSSGLLSKALKASFNTVTSFKPKRIFITGENDPSITRPEGVTVLTTGTF